MKFLRQRSKLFKASVLLAVFSLLSRFLGLIRDRILASRFGASDILDVYYISFNIPDLIFNLLVVGAVSSAFIPVFIEYKSGKKGGEWNIASNFLNTLLLGVAALSVLLFFLAPIIIRFIAPGFTAEKKDLTILFTRVMLFSPLIFSISVVFGSILQVFNRFFFYSLAPVMYNLGIIIGALVLEPMFGPLGLAEGVLLGAVLHLIVQVPGAIKIGFRWQMIINFTNEGMRKIFVLMIPRTIGLAAMQINWIVLNALTTTISVGSVAILNFANNLQYIPIALIGISVAVASFPTLSQEALKEDKRNFTERIDKTLRQIIFIILPLSFLFVYLREDIVRIVLGVGKFSMQDVHLTAKILGLFILGVFAQTMIPFLSRSFYALQDTKAPVISAVISVGINIILALYLIFKNILSQTILVFPLAFSLAGIFNVLLLLILLNKKLPQFNLGKILRYFGKILIVSSVMLIIVMTFDYFLNLRFTTTVWGSFYHGLTSSILGMLTFAAISYKLKDIKPEH